MLVAQLSICTDLRTNRKRKIYSNVLAVQNCFEPMKNRIKIKLWSRIFEDNSWKASWN